MVQGEYWQLLRLVSTVNRGCDKHMGYWQHVAKQMALRIVGVTSCTCTCEVP